MTVEGTDRVREFGLTVGTAAKQQNLPDGPVAVGGDGELDAEVVGASLAGGVKVGACGGQVEGGT